MIIQVYRHSVQRDCPRVDAGQLDHLLPAAGRGYRRRRERPGRVQRGGGGRVGQRRLRLLRHQPAGPGHNALRERTLEEEKLDSLKLRPESATINLSLFGRPMQCGPSHCGKPPLFSTTSFRISAIFDALLCTTDISVALIVIVVFVVVVVIFMSVIPLRVILEVSF